MLPPIPMFDMFRPPVRPAPTARPLRWAVIGIAAGLLAVGGVQAAAVLGDNFHAVVPGRVYRSAQLKPDALARHAERVGVRTVVNLRGCCEEFDWYRGEHRTSRDLGIAQEDIFLSANRLPSPPELRRLVEVLDRADRPLLLHCRRGVDRTGVAAAAARLLDARYSYTAGRGQLGVWYGHVPVNGTGAMDKVFDLYEAWLARLGIDHTPKVFRHWATREYCPGPCRAELTNLTGPLRAKPDESALLRVRCRNVSAEPWVLRPGTEAGVHVRFALVAGDGRRVALGYAGQFDARVPVGEAIDLELAIPPTHAPGLYSVCVDMGDGENTSFLQVGSEPLMVELRAE